MNNHTYILEEGAWRASGKYYDEHQNGIEITGETRIIHNPGAWILDGCMELKLDTPIKFCNKYTIQPFESEKDFTFWSSKNPALGKLSGNFMVVGDTILSSYQSENKKYSGSECLVLINAALYKNRGFAFFNRRKLSSWEVDLIRV